MSLQLALCYGTSLAEPHVFESTMVPHLMESQDKLWYNRSQGFIEMHKSM